MPKQWIFYLGLFFSTSGIVSYFSFLLGLTGFWIVPFLVIKFSEVLFLLLLWGIRCWYGVTFDKLYLCPDKTEILKSSLQISIYGGFPILVILLDKLVFEIDLDLFTVLTGISVSVIWVDLELSKYLPLSYLLLLDVSTVLLDAYRWMA